MVVAMVRANAHWESARPNLELPNIEARLRHLGLGFFFTENKSVVFWLRYKHFSDLPNSKIFAGILKSLANH